MKLRQRLAATTWAPQDFDSSQIGIHPDSIQSINTAKVLQVCIKFQFGNRISVSTWKFQAALAIYRAQVITRIIRACQASSPTWRYRLSSCHWASPNL